MKTNYRHSILGGIIGLAIAIITLFNLNHDFFIYIYAAPIYILGALNQELAICLYYLVIGLALGFACAKVFSRRRKIMSTTWIIFFHTVVTILSLAHLSKSIRQLLNDPKFGEIVSDALSGS